MIYKAIVGNKHGIEWIDCYLTFFVAIRRVVAE